MTLPPAPLRAFVARFNRGEYWASHESLELGWRRNRSPFYHGLILYVSALVHLHRRNAHGVVAQLDKALPLLRRYRHRYLGLDVEELTRHAASLRRRVASDPSRNPPGLRPPVLRLGPVNGDERELEPPESPAEIAAEIGRRIGELANTTTPTVRRLRREYTRRLDAASGRFILEIANRLRDRGSVHRFLGYELILHHAGARARLDAKALARLSRGMNSWDAVDTFACYLAGPAWRERQLSDAVVFGWARSRNHWWRRAALVCTVPLNTPAKGGRGDTRRTLMVCRMLTDDTDDMVQKAMSWALRELVRHDASAVRRFIADQRDRLPARVLREVGNKLATGLKNPRRRRR